MKKSAAWVVFAFVMFCSIAVAPAAGLHSASAKRAAAADVLKPVDSPDFALGDLTQVSRLYALLRDDYGYRPDIDPVSRFAQGAPVLTPEAAHLALSNARSAAARLTAETSALETLFVDRERGEIAAADFARKLSETLTRIEALADEIGRDAYIDILDRKLAGKTDEPAAAAFHSGTAALQLRRLAEEITRGVESYWRPDGLPVVSVKDLRRPSLNSISQAVARLTQALRGAAPQM